MKTIYRFICMCCGKEYKSPVKVKSLFEDEVISHGLCSEKCYKERLREQKEKEVADVVNI